MDTSADGGPAVGLEVYELRVHGVSGTPPDSALEVPAVRQVAGDGAAGFYRQERPDGTADPGDGGRLREAYSWGGLTSGGWLRPLWLLLTPFLLVNVAMFTAAVPLAADTDYAPHLHAEPSARVPDGSRRGWWVRRTLEAVLRLLGLLMTLTAVAAIISPAMDVVGFQYLRRSSELPAWLSFLRWPWLTSPQRRFALSALVPLAFVVLLWRLAQQTWKNLDAVEVPQADAAEVRTPLEDRSMWNGGAAVRRLRAVHVAAALSLLAVAVLLPLWHGARPLSKWSVVWDRPTGPVVVLLAVLAGVLLLTCLLVVLAPAMSRRERPGRRRPRSGDLLDRWSYGALPGLGLALAIAAVLLVWFGPAWRDAWPARTTGGLPGWAEIVQLLLTAAAPPLTVAAAAALWLRWALMRDAYPQTTHAGDGGASVRTSPVWGGLAPAALPLLGWLLVAGWAAGLTFAVARMLGTPRPSSAPAAPTDLVVPAAFTWSAVIAFLTAAAALLAGLGVVARIRFRRRHPEKLLAEFTGYPGRPAVEDEARARRDHVVARAWLLGDLDGPAQLVLLTALVVPAVAAVVAMVAYWQDSAWPSTHTSFAVVLGTWALAGAAVWLIATGRRAFKDVDLRRKIGILWDLGAFWPRSAHPLAPPCYMERVMPDLLSRVDQPGSPVRNSRAIILSCHSQGTVIGAALLMQAANPDGRLRFLSYGSPLRRLYATVFPAYFGRVPLGRLGQFLSTERWQEGTAFDDGPGAREHWQWRNLHRATDPIGGPVFADYRCLVPQTGDVDQWLWDPRYAPDAGDTCPPAAQGHGGYPADPAYESALTALSPASAPYRTTAEVGPGVSPIPEQTRAEAVVIIEYTDG